MKFLTKILNLLFKSKNLVGCDHGTYLTRWYVIRRESFGVFIHRFVRSDEDQELHDHPWSFITFILWRGYFEHTDRDCPRCVTGGYHAFAGECAQCGGDRRVNITKRIWPGSVLFRPAEWRHRVELAHGKPAWTLVIRFKERREWGFWTRRGWVQWNKFWQNKNSD